MVAALLLCACSSIDCPMNTTVLSTYMLKGDVAKLSGSLTIRGLLQPDMDSVLLNSAQNVDSFSLPMSYARAVDELYFEVTDTAGTRIDTVRIEKTNEPHFEAVDCNPAYFHTITGVSTTHNAIDSISINNKKVNYEATRANFYVYFKSRMY